jgi:hypothetical protein
LDPDPQKLISDNTYYGGGGDLLLGIRIWDTGSSAFSNLEPYLGYRKSESGLASKRCRSTCGSYTKFYTCGKIGRKYLLLITAITNYNDFPFLSVDSKLEFSGKKYVHRCM